MTNEAAQFQALQELIKKGDYFKFRIELENVKNVNFQNKEGVTLLRFAAGESNFPAVVALLARGAQTDIPDQKGLTPLTISIWKGFLHIAASLLQAGADPNIADKIGRVPLFFAVRRCDIRSVRLLLDFKADPNRLCPVKDENGQVIQGTKISLLAVAAKACFHEGIKLLRDAGARLDIGNANPLAITIERGNRETLAALLAGQESEILGKYNGKSLLAYAVEKKTTLLAVIAATAEAQKKGSFPPEDVRGNKKLDAALAQKDKYLPNGAVIADSRAALSIWKPLDDDTRRCRGTKVSVKALEDAMKDTEPRPILDPLPGDDEYESEFTDGTDEIPSPPSTTPPTPDEPEETDSLERFARKAETAPKDDEQKKKKVPRKAK